MAHEFPAQKHILVLCGRGRGNAGNALVAAQPISMPRAGGVSRCSVGQARGFAVGGARRLPEAAATIKFQSLVTVTAEEDLSRAMFESCSNDPELLIDAILGTGFHPPLRGSSPHR